MTESLGEGMHATGGPADLDDLMPDGVTGRIGAYLDAVARAHPDATVIDTEAKSWLAIADVRALLDSHKSLTAENERHAILIRAQKVIMGQQFEDLQRLRPENERLTGALELLHARILRDLPNDGSELPQPEDPWWATQLDSIVTYAVEVYATAMGFDQ